MPLIISEKFFIEARRNDIFTSVLFFINPQMIEKLIKLIPLIQLFRLLELLLLSFTVYHFLFTVYSLLFTVHRSLFTPSVNIFSFCESLFFSTLRACQKTSSSSSLLRKRRPSRNTSALIIPSRLPSVIYVTLKRKKWVSISRTDSLLPISSMRTRKLS